MTMWNADSDVDYDMANGNGDRWARRDEQYEAILEERNARDPEYEQWLADHGFFDALTDADLEAMRIDQESRPLPCRSLDAYTEDDIAF